MSTRRRRGGECGAVRPDELVAVEAAGDLDAGETDRAQRVDAVLVGRDDGDRCREVERRDVVHAVRLAAVTPHVVDDPRGRHDHAVRGLFDALDVLDRGVIGRGFTGDLDCDGAPRPAEVGRARDEWVTAPGEDRGWERVAVAAGRRVRDRDVVDAEQPVCGPVHARTVRGSSAPSHGRRSSDMGIDKRDGLGEHAAHCSRVIGCVEPLSADELIPVSPHDIAQSALTRLRDWIGQSDQIGMLTEYSLAFLMGVFLTIVLLAYFLVSGRQVARGIFWIVPPHRRPLVARIWTRLDPVLLRYFIGVLAIVVYATVAAYIGLGVILGINHAVFLAVLTGFVEIVPVVGPTSAAILAGLVSLRTATGLISIVEYAAYATLLRLSIDQIVGPIVLGRAAHVHPVLIIFCFLAGGVVLGIPGVILAVPVALVVKSTLATVYGDTPK